MILTDDRDLSFEFEDACKCCLFDQMNPHLPDYHGISEMHRVDFIIELDDALLFVEVKDPSHPNARQESLDNFLNEIDNGTLGKTFADKFMDSFIYRWAEDKINKPIYYLGLITLETALLLHLEDQVNKMLPPKGKPISRWKRSLLENCQFFNIETWNMSFPKWPVTRISDSKTGQR